jgi:membrane protein YdbS with pleckstrin-like domain
MGAAISISDNGRKKGIQVSDLTKGLVSLLVVLLSVVVIIFLLYVGAKEAVIGFIQGLIIGVIL